MSTQEPSTTYEYTQLEPNQIRVLDLLSAPGEELQCRLRAVSAALTTDGLSYVALSYVWGSPVRTTSIKVVDGNGQRLGDIPLTANLHTALQDLRDAAHIQPKTFWIDQICINQDDIDEKSNQVAKMSKVYSSASRVVTYLGPQGHGDEVAVQLLRRLHDWFMDKSTVRQGPDPDSALVHAHLQAIYKSPLQATVLFLYPTDEHIPLDLRFSLTADDRAACKQISRLIDSQGWCTRAWMFQENLLNATTGFLRGPHYIPWAHLSVWAVATTAGLVHEEPCTPLAMFHEWRHRRDQYEFNRLLFLLSVGRNCLNCQDERDRIYALLGVASDAAELQMKPDYHKSTVQVFTDLAVGYIRSSKTGYRKLLILERIDQKSPQAGKGEEQEQERDTQQGPQLWPSWVPSFKLECYIFSTKNPETRLAGCLHPSCPPGRFDESISFESDPSAPLVENSILVADGLALSKLGVYLGSMSNILNGPRLPKDLKETLDTLNRAADRLESNNAAGRCSDTASPGLMLCRAMLMDDAWPAASDYESSTETRSAESYAAATFNNLRHVLDSEGDGLQIAMRTGVVVTRPDAHPDLLDSAGYIISHGLGIKGRTLWLLEDGKLALAPAVVREGDVPVLLPADKWVYFLRPVGGRGHGEEDPGYYEYVGWGYVHGVMDGKVFENENWEDMARTFRIR
ncbi:heterokaryon incompatibility protein-domain-containing protein [Coniella lustricola]|uniref:Heterokaryon incompatibility protein-domain-containing protein n=1 Tax=Coniella lustricola TaxID=2025994 RepID=A0A2T3A5V9_9PEZI|nr:heterokaryon incompatibility protein-domain-containing protein [Coniella lustricola]